MSTPLCNCPADMGWQTEAAYVAAYGEAAKTTAQPIYCVNGSPVVPPRGGFFADLGDARCDWSDTVPDPAGLGRLFGGTGTGVDMRALAPSTGVIDLTFTNPYSYPIQLMGETQVSSIIRIDPVGDMSTDYTFYWRLNTEVKVNGVATTPAATIYRSYQYAQSSVDTRLTQIQFSASRRLPTLAAGASTTIGLYPTWDGGSLQGKIITFASAIRVWAGTAPP